MSEIPKKHNMVISVLLFMLGALVFARARNFPKQVNIFPYFVAYGIMLTSVLLFLTQKSWSRNQSIDAGRFKILTYPAFIVFMISCASVLLFIWGGIYVCVSLTVVFFTLFFKGLKWRYAILSLVILNAFIYFVFYKYLNVPLPEGIFTL